LTNLTSQSNNRLSHRYLFGSENPECKTHLRVTTAELIKFIFDLLDK
jgi:hypothetical protein